MVIRLDVGRAIGDAPVLCLTTHRTAKGRLRTRVKEGRAIADALVASLPVGTLEHLGVALEFRMPYYFRAGIAEIQAERALSAKQRQPS